MNRIDDKINLADSLQLKLFKNRMAAACKRSDEGTLGLREQEFLWSMMPVLSLVQEGLPAKITGKQMNYLKAIAEGGR